MFRALQKNRYVARYRRLLGSALASNPVTTWLPSSLSQLAFWGLDSANTPLLIRHPHSGKLAVKNYSRTGDVRAVQPGRCYDNASGTDIVNCGTFDITGWTTAYMKVSFRSTAGLDGVRWLFAISHKLNEEMGFAILANDDPTVTRRNVLFAKIDDGTTAYSVIDDGGVLVGTDDVWHDAELTWDGTTLEVFLDGVSVGTVAASGFDPSTSNSGATVLLARAGPLNYATDVQIRYAAFGQTSSNLVFETYCDEGSGTTCFDRSGNGNNGTITAASIGNFHDATTNNVYSAQNELGYLLSDGSTYYENDDDTGLIASGVFIPRDDSTPTKATAFLAGGTQADLGFSGEVPHHAPLGSPGITLDGANDYLTAGARVTSGAVEDLYCSVWVKAGDAATYIVVGEVETNGSNWGWQVYHSTSRAGKLQFAWSHNGSAQTALASSGLFADGQWHHVAVHKDGLSVSMWIDGVPQSITTVVANATTAINDSITHFVVGARNVTSTTELYLDGQVADVRLATGAAAATAAANVAAEYANGTLSAGCLQWRLGEGTGTSFAETGGGTALTGNFASTPAAHANKQQFADTANVAGTGELDPLNEVDTTFDEPESPIAERLEAAGVDQPLTDADANVSGRQYQSTDGNKILLFDPAISGGDITDVEGYIA